MIMGTERRMYIKGKPMLQHELDTIYNPRVTNSLLVMKTNLKKLNEDGHVYIANKDYAQFEKVLNSKGIAFHAFDLYDNEVLVELDIKEEE